MCVNSKLDKVEERCKYRYIRQSEPAYERPAVMVHCIIVSVTQLGNAKHEKQGLITGCFFCFSKLLSIKKEIFDELSSVQRLAPSLK
jgi:hypothetical protein